MLTHEKARELFESGTMFKKVAPGMAKGYEICKVFDFDPSERTYWGPGTIVLEMPFDPNEPKCRYALRQVEIYENGNGNSGRRRKKKSRRTK